MFCSKHRLLALMLTLCLCLTALVPMFALADGDVVGAPSLDGQATAQNVTANRYTKRATVAYTDSTCQIVAKKLPKGTYVQVRFISGGIAFTSEGWIPANMLQQDFITRKP